MCLRHTVPLDRSRFVSGKVRHPVPYRHDWGRHLHLLRLEFYSID